MPDISTKTQLGSLTGAERLYAMLNPGSTKDDRSFDTALIPPFVFAHPGFAAAVQGAEANALALPTALTNPASPITPSGLTRSSIVRVNNITGDKVLNAPSIAGVTGRLFIQYEFTATGGPFTVTMGTGFSQDGIGVTTTTFTVPANGTLQIPTYSDNGSAWKYQGDFFGSTQFGGGQVIAATAGAKPLMRRNSQWGSLVGVIAECDAGTCTVDIQIADNVSSTNLGFTAGASVGGLNAIAVTTTPTYFPATSGNALGRSGTADRGISATPSSIVTAAEIRLELYFAP